MASDLNEFDDEEGNYVLLNNKKIFKKAMYSKNNAEFLNGVFLYLDVSFGYYQEPIRKNVYFAAEDTLIYLSGKHIVEYDIIRKKETYIQKALEDETILSMNYYMSKKKVLSIAVALKSTTRVLPQVKIYNNSKTKSIPYSLVHSHLSPISSKIIDISFFIKSKFLLTLSETDQKYSIAVWQISKQKLLTYIDIDEEINKIMLSGQSNEEFCLLGKNYFKIWNFNPTDKNLTLLPQNFLKIVSENLVDSCWIHTSPYLLIVNSTNTIYLFRNSELIRSYKHIVTQKEIDQTFTSNIDEKPNGSEANNEINSINYNINCICATAKGFACGLAGIGVISLFEIDKNEQIILKNNFKIKDDQINKIHSLHTSADDMYIAVSMLYNLKSSYIYLDSTQIEAEPEPEIKETGKLEISVFNIAVVDAIRTAYKDPFEPLFEKGVHKGSILSLSVCPSKSIFVSLGEDKYAKFWEFGQEPKGIFSHYFNEIPLCLSLHPLAIQCAVGFKEGVNVFYVLDDELKPVYRDTTSTKSCNAISYSDGGNLLAAGNHSQINIYNSYTFEKITWFNGHTGLLKELLWSSNDTMLISSCNQGLLFCWLLSKADPIVEHAPHKQLKYNAVTYDPEFDLVICCCADSKLRLFTEKGQNLSYEYDTTPYQFTSVSICKKMNVIFFGTNVGSIRVYIWPIYDFKAETLEFIEFPIHQGSLTNIKITADFMYMITGSEDSSIFMSRIREFADGNDISSLDMLTALNKQKNKDFVGKVTNAFSLNSICLTSRTSHDLKRDQINKLKFKVTNLRGEIDDEKEKLANTYYQRIKTLEEKNRDQISKQKEKMKQTMESADRMHKTLLDQIESQRKEFAAAKIKEEENNSKQLLECYHRNDILLETISEMKNRFSNEQSNHSIEYNRTLNEVESEYQQKYQDLYNKFTGALGNMKTDQKKFDEVFIQSEEEFERFLEVTKKELQDQLTEEESKSENHRSEISKVEKENEKLGERLLQLETLIKDTKAQINHLEEQKLNFTEKIKTMLKQLEEREKIINIKEEQIKEFRSKNIHLQNFRAVYDYRVTTLKDERTPLLDHLENMDKHVKMMYKELLEEAGGNKNLDEKINENNEKIKELKNNLKHKNEILSCTKRQIENFEYEISDLMRNYKFEDWKKRMEEIFAKNFENNGKIENFIQKGSTIGASIQELQKDSLLESLEKNIHEAIKDELIRYRDFMSKKLITMTKVNKRIENDRDEIFLKIQNENTNLIIECNRLRKLKHEIKTSLSSLQKSLKEITRDLTNLATDLNETNFSIEEETEIIDPHLLIERNNSQKKIITNKIKTELPFVKYVNEKKILMAKNNESPIKEKDNHKLFNLLMEEVDKHKIETVNQGDLIEKLREKVHNFLYNEDSSNSKSFSNVNKSLPNIKDKIGHVSAINERSVIGNDNKNLKISGNNIILTPQKKL